MKERNNQTKKKGGKKEKKEKRKEKGERLRRRTIERTLPYNPRTPQLLSPPPPETDQ